METFYRTHSYLVEHTNAPVRRDLMDEIDWNDRLIGIKGTRGVGKTTLAEILCYAFLSEQWELIPIRSLEDGFAAINNNRKQVFFFDDFHNG